jgi:Flp pilus assembly protein TadG
MSLGHKMRNFLTRLKQSSSGNALVEFGYVLPVLVFFGGAGVELANFAVANHKVSQATLALADNMSRVGVANSLAITQIREADVVDSFAGFERQTEGLDVLTRGRIILSSLQRSGSPGSGAKARKA